MSEQAQNIHTVIDYYNVFNEQERLSDLWGHIEFVRLLEIIRKTEDEPALLGASPHIMCVARKP